MTAVDAEYFGPAVTSWAQCDRCNKWRRIPKSVADELQDDAQWCVLSTLGAFTLSAEATISSVDKS